MRFLVRKATEASIHQSELVQPSKVALHRRSSDCLRLVDLALTLSLDGIRSRDSEQTMTGDETGSLSVADECDNCSTRCVWTPSNEGICHVYTFVELDLFLLDSGEAVADRPSEVAR